MQKRGMLTDRIKVKSKELLGYEITQAELRLMPYLATILKDEQRIDIRRVNDDELDILSKWAILGFLQGHVENGIRVTHEFWTAMSEILYLGYVDRD